MSSKWYRLDNAAKIFPVVATARDPGSFRLSAIFQEEINAIALQQAVEDALKRFPTFHVRLRKGFFWYYFDQNTNQPLIKMMEPHLYGTVKPRKNRGLLFQVSYFGTRMSIEIFHALSDGTGGMEFFKTICYYYLLQCGKSIENDGSILTNEYEHLLTEDHDSFLENYDETHQAFEKESKAFRIKGAYYQNNWFGCLHFMIPIQELKAISKRYQATITEYLGARILYAVYQVYQSKNKKNRPMKLFIPVNARKFFSSQSIRNFVLYIRVSIEMKQEITFEKILEYVKESFQKELKPDRLMSRLVGNVRIEKNIFVRMMPLFMKKIGMKIGYRILGSGANTLSFSNLGIVMLPPAMKNYIKRMEFSISVSDAAPINFGGVTFEDTFVLTAMTKLIDRKFLQFFIRGLTSDGLNIVIETNDLEVEI